MLDTALSVLILAGIAGVFAYLVRLNADFQSFRLKYLDALGSISIRAQKAEDLCASQTRVIAAFSDSIGDRKLSESQATHVAWLQERLTEAQRAVVALTDLRAQQTVVNQAKPSEPAPIVPYRPSRWAMAAGISEPPLHKRVVSDTLSAPKDYAIASLDGNG